MKKIKPYLLLLIIVSYFFCNCYEANALTLRQLYNELSSLEKNYNAAKNKANLSQAEMNKIKASIASAEAEIKKAQQEIIVAENEIKKSETEIEKKKEETNQMLLYLQLMNSRGDSILEYVMDADNYTDFIYRYSVVTQMSDYNQGLMDELNKLIEQLNKRKEELNKKQEDLAKKKSDLQAKYLIVQVQYKDEYDDSLSIAGQIEEKKKIIAKYKSMGCKMDQDVNNCNNIAAVTGWTYPISTFIQSSNYGWDENRYHYAVDLAVSEGTAVKAVANGEVISSRVYWKQNNPGHSCGGYVIQIKHNANGSYYVSLYMHLISGNVSVGDKVRGGQVIGTSGGGAQEIAKWHDDCTKGAHLHFAMANGEGVIGSSSTAGSTFNPVRFFPAMKGIGSRL